MTLSCLMKPNFPPVEHTEERFHDWNPQLEIRLSGCVDFEIPPIINPRADEWGDWEDYYQKDEKRLLHLAAANRTSRWKKGFGQADAQAEEPERVRYAKPDQWIPRVFEANNIVFIGVNWGWRCVCCTFDADQAQMLKHITEADHLRLASKSDVGVWANQSVNTTVEPSGSASSSSVALAQPWPDYSDVAAMDELAAKEMHPWSDLLGKGSTPVTTWQPASVKSGLVQELTTLPEAMRLAQTPTSGASKLTYEQMAIQFPEQGVVVPGSSFILADSSMTCIRTLSKWGELLTHKTKKKYVSTEARTPVTWSIGGIWTKSLILWRWLVRSRTL
jgi:hypothetical protein